MKKVDMTLIFLFLGFVLTVFFKCNLLIPTSLLLILGLALFFRESEVSIVLRVLLCLYLFGMMVLLFPFLVLAARAYLYA